MCLQLLLYPLQLDLGSWFSHNDSFAGAYRVLATGQEVLLHPSSVLHGKRPECVVFGEMVRTSKQYVRGVTVVEPSWLPELAPSFFAQKLPG
jgi:ATP-dependent RNA helicase DHX8/PRP22